MELDQKRNERFADLSELRSCDRSEANLEALVSYNALFVKYIIQIAYKRSPTNYMQFECPNYQVSCKFTICTKQSI